MHTALVGKLAEKKVLRGRKLRVHTTVVEANIHYPTDIQLLADGTRVVTRTVRRVQADRVAAQGRFRDVSRSIKRRLQSLGKGLKQPKAKKLALRATLTAEVLSIVKGAVRRAEDVLKQAAHEVQRQEGCVKRRVERRMAQLGTWLERTRRVIEQTGRVLGGDVHIHDRLVSLLDPDARPIRKGKLAVAGGTGSGTRRCSRRKSGASSRTTRSSRAFPETTGWWRRLWKAISRVSERRHAQWRRTGA